MIGLAIVMMIGYAHLNTASAASASGSNGFIVDAALGINHGVAVAKDGTVWAWGNNGLGQLGVGNAIKESRSPIKVGGIEKMIAVDAGGYHTVALREDGTVWVWGSNSNGQLGDGTYTSYGPPDSGGASRIADNRTAYQPQVVPNLSGIVGIKATGNGVVAWDKDGSLWGWGQSSIGNPFTGMNEEFEKEKLTPKRNEAIETVASVSGQGSMLAALAKDGTIRTQGSGAFGELGDGRRSNAVSTVHVQDLANVIRVDSTGRTTIAYLKDRKVLEWGQSLLRSKGLNPTDPADIDKIPVHLKPEATKDLQGFSAIQSTIYKFVEPSLLALKPDGSVWAHGDNAYGQLGVIASIKERYTWAKVEGLPSVAAIKGSGAIGAAVGKDGSLWTWGRNANAQLGDGTTINRFAPVSIGGFGSTTSEPVKEADGYRLIVNGQPIALVVRPELKGTAFVASLAQTAKAFGAKLTWDKSKQAATITRDKHKVVLKLNSALATVDGKAAKHPFATRKSGGDWLISADWLAKQLGGTAKPDTGKRILTVTFSK